jgi:hypothetical protein
MAPIASRSSRHTGTGYCHSRQCPKPPNTTDSAVTPLATAETVPVPDSGFAETCHISYITSGHLFLFRSGGFLLPSELLSAVGREGAWRVVLSVIAIAAAPAPAGRSGSAEIAQSSAQSAGAGQQQLYARGCLGCVLCVYLQAVCSFVCSTWCYMHIKCQWRAH